MKFNKLFCLPIILFSFYSLAVENKLIEECETCHGESGVSTNSTIPIISGLAAVNIEDAFSMYKNGEREAKDIDGNDMTKVANSLSEKEVSDISLYYSLKLFKASNQIYDKTLVNAGKKIHIAKCDICHSEGGTLADDETLILAGQWTPYLRESINLFISGERYGDDTMVEELQALSEKHIEALLAYYASLK